MPESLIAKFPLPDKGACNLMILKKSENLPPITDLFRNLGKFLPPCSLLVLNNTRVLPARLKGSRQSGGKLEFLQLTPLPLLEIKSGAEGTKTARAEALLRPLARVKIGEELDFGRLHVRVLAKGEYGRAVVELRWLGDLEKIFTDTGELPLPPYLARPAAKSDITDYQTVFARRTGAVAAPTAGLHFDQRHLYTLAKDFGCSFCEVTLHVGYGTFTPVRESDIRSHKMHPEYVEISADSAAAIACAKKEGRPIIAVGTTSLRALEGACAAAGEMREFKGWTNIFIYPGRKVKIVDGLLTNFHLPRSSLLMLVSALTGRERLLQAYELAKSSNFRFFSYGDAMLII